LPARAVTPTLTTGSAIPFSAFYANRALEEPVRDSDWMLIRQFDTLGTGPTSHVGTFCSGEYPGWRGEAMAVFEVGPESWGN
jgi:hypothetical protein